MHWQYIPVLVNDIWYTWRAYIQPRIASNVQIVNFYSPNDACRIIGWVIRQTGELK